MTKPFFKRGDATIYYNYSEWPSRSCNFRKSLSKPRPFLYSPKFLGRRGSRYILSGTSGKKKSREKKGRGAAGEKGEERDEEQKVGGSEGEDLRRRRRMRRRRENKRAIGNRTESFSLACLACYDGISEMAELSLSLALSLCLSTGEKEEGRKTEEQGASERERRSGIKRG